MTSSILTSPETSRANWRPSDMNDPAEWTRELTPAEVKEINLAISDHATSKTPLEELDSRSFHLPTLVTRIAEWRRELEDGRGCLLVRGLPVHSYSKRQAQLAYWAIGSHMGVAVPQNAAGDLLGDVRDTGKKYGEATVRGYQTKTHLPFHTDSSDIVGLLCWRPAKSGGLSRVVSSVAIYNEILRTHPHLVPLLYDEWYFDLRGENPEGEVPYYTSPLCAYVNGKLSIRYIRDHIETAQRFLGVPKLTDDQRKLLDLIDHHANSSEFCMNMEFRRGDIQLVSNYTILHSRTEYEDFEEPDLKRHLFRLWLTLPESRPLPPNFGRSSGDDGGRGGVRIKR